MGILLNRSKNYIINGAMDFWQRSVGPANLTTSQVYAGPDRFLTYYTGTVTGTPTVARSTDVPANLGLTYSSEISARRNASTLSKIWYQRIESNFIKGMGNKNAAFSFWIKAAVASTVNVLLVSYATVDAGGTGTTFYTQTAVNLTAGVWTKISGTTLLPDVSNGLGMYIVNAYASGTDGAAHSSFVTAIQLEEGVSPSNFERAGVNIASELMLCQRYYEKSCDLDSTVVSSPGSINFTGLSVATYYFSFPFKVTKRVVPTVTPYSNTGVINTWRDTTSAVNRVAASTNVGQSFASIGVNNTVAGNQNLGQWVADAEL